MNTLETPPKTPCCERDTLLGLVAGEGKLPGILARSAKERGYKVIALAFTPEAQTSIQAHAEKVFLAGPGQLGRSFKILEQEKVKQVVFIGKVPKIQFLKNIFKLDWMAIRELSKLPNFNDDTIQFAVGDLLAARGVTVRTQSEFLRELFPDIGVLTKKQPSTQEYADIEYGKRIAKEIARLDIGQTVIVREQMTLAIEAIEGTDEAIRRAVQMARNPVVVVKVSKPNQDQRFDIPTVGLNTLNSMLGPKPGGVLAVEANETMVVEREEMVAFADQHNICIVAV